MPVLNNVFPIPTGGAIGLSLTTATSGSIALSRAVSGSGGLGAFVTLYSGAPLSATGEACFFLDLGDQTPGPLQAGSLYVYQLTDNTGTVQSSPTATPSSINIEEVQYEQIIINLLQGAINTARDGGTLAPGIKWARVMSAMPLTGNFPLPAIFVNPDLIAQEHIPIGQDNETIGDLIQPAQVNNWTQTEQDRHMFRITVMALSAEERNYYRDFCAAVLRIAVAYAFSQIGADSSHNLEMVSYQEVDQTNLMIPGFYAADILYEFVGVGNIKITTSYGLISTITTTTSGYPDYTNIYITENTFSSTPGLGTPVVDETEVTTPIARILEDDITDRITEDGLSLRILERELV
jgi:hypothetical protein